jgi:predicted transcriptional regulator
MIKLTLYRTRKGGIIYAPGILFRVISCLFFGVVLVGIVLNLIDGAPWPSMVIPVLLGLLSFCATWYRESWNFDPQKRCVTSVFGVACFVRKETIPFSEIDRLELNHFVRGSVPGYEMGLASKALKPNKRRNKAMVVFSIHLKDDAMRDIEIIPEKTSQGRTEHAAQVIAAISGLALVVDRPRDMDIDVGVRDI